MPHFSTYLPVYLKLKIYIGLSYNVLTWVALILGLESILREMLIDSYIRVFSERSLYV